MNNITNVMQILGLNKPPIAISFFDSPPAGVPQWKGEPVPAGCVFWQQAFAGQTFYTLPTDHYNCAVGSYTHKISLPPERAHELTDTLTFMDQSNYVLNAEVPGIPTLAKTPGAVAYGPLDKVQFKPDLVLIAAKPAQAMLLYEAALKAGAGCAIANTLGRPACAVLPLTLGTSQASISLGCIGNRTYTGLPDEEMYVSIPGVKWQAVVDKLTDTDQANTTMENYYSAQKSKFAA